MIYLFFINHFKNISIFLLTKLYFIKVFYISDFAIIIIYNNFII